MCMQCSTHILQFMLIIQRQMLSASAELSLESMLIDVLLPPQAPIPPLQSVAMARNGALIALALCLSVFAVADAQGKGKDNIAFGNDAITRLTGEEISRIAR